ncbi:hypothetical protein KKC91_04360 [bacterium]|nr:hypothetical protein [bacterium]MBU1853687.1 hypothetical protein [Candidatus Omnitrophota bacterium]
MENVSHKLLKELINKKELTLCQIFKILPKKYNDHRDIYPFASLITGGYIDSVMSHDGKDIFNAKNKELAITLYTASFGKGEFEYNGQKLVNDGDFNKQTFFCTAKANLYLEERRQKRSDRIWTLFIGIAIGIIVAIITFFLTKKFGLN